MLLAFLPFLPNHSLPVRHYQQLRQPKLKSSYLASWALNLCTRSCSQTGMSVRGWHSYWKWWFIVDFPIENGDWWFSIAIYHLVMTNSLPWKDPPFLRTVNHLFLWAIFHGYVSHNQRVTGLTRLTTTHPGIKQPSSWKLKCPKWCPKIA